MMLLRILLKFVNLYQILMIMYPFEGTKHLTTIIDRMA